MDIVAQVDKAVRYEDMDELVSIRLNPLDWERYRQIQTGSVSDKLRNRAGLEYLGVPIVKDLEVQKGVLLEHSSDPPNDAISEDCHDESERTQPRAD